VGRPARFERREAPTLTSAPMNSAVRIDTEPDPVPMVLILAATLRRAARTPQLASAIGSTKGNVALRSTVDPQAATLRFGDGGVIVVRGVSPDADVVIAADVNKLADEHPPKPKVTGAARHPKLALTVAKLLEPPHGTWQEEAQRFFEHARETNPRLPRGVRVVCIDDGSELALGDTPAEFEIHGSNHALLNIFCGNSVLGQDLLDGKLFAVGKLAHLAELTGSSLSWMLGR
jgi:hypothetical protein